jgi:hypothetical protein
MSAEPIVNGIQEEYKDELVVMKINVQTDVGKEIGMRYGFEFTPSFLLFNADGEILLQTIGLMDTDQIRTALGQP